MLSVVIFSYLYGFIQPQTTYIINLFHCLHMMSLSTKSNLFLLQLYIPISISMLHNSFLWCLLSSRTYRVYSFLLFILQPLIIAKLNAAWELIRSCILPCVHGRKYQEGGLLLCMRVIGLLFPGMPAHCPQDYVNSTRLGSSDHLQSIKRLAQYQHNYKIINYPVCAFQNFLSYILVFPCTNVLLDI